MGKHDRKTHTISTTTTTPETPETNEDDDEINRQRVFHMLLHNSSVHLTALYNDEHSSEEEKNRLVTLVGNAMDAVQQNDYNAFTETYDTYMRYVVPLMRRSGYPCTCDEKHGLEINRCTCTCTSVDMKDLLPDIKSFDIIIDKARGRVEIEEIYNECKDR